MIQSKTESEIVRRDGDRPLAFSRKTEAHAGLCNEWNVSARIMTGTVWSAARDRI